MTLSDFIEKLWFKWKTKTMKEFHTGTGEYVEIEHIKASIKKIKEKLMIRRNGDVIHQEVACWIIDQEMGDLG